MIGIIYFTVVVIVIILNLQNQNMTTFLIVQLKSDEVGNKMKYWIHPFHMNLFRLQNWRILLKVKNTENSWHKCIMELQF